MVDSTNVPNPECFMCEVACNLHGEGKDLVSPPSTMAPASKKVSGTKKTLKDIFYFIIKFSMIVIFLKEQTV